MSRMCAVAFGSQLKEISSLFQEDDRRMDFAIDMASGDIYRDTRTRKMSFVKPHTREVVAIPNVGPKDGRSIVTKDQFLEFDPNQLPGTDRRDPDSPGDRPQTHRRAVTPPTTECIGSHHGDMMDPRAVLRLRRRHEDLGDPRDDGEGA